MGVKKGVNYPGAGIRSDDRLAVFTDPSGGYQYVLNTIYRDTVDSQSYGSCWGYLRRCVNGGAYDDAPDRLGSRAIRPFYSSACPFGITSARGRSKQLIILGRHIVLVPDIWERFIQIAMFLYIIQI